MNGSLVRIAAIALTASAAAPALAADTPGEAGTTNPLWHERKVRNYLPHMTWPEVGDLLTRSDMVIIPVASLEQHGHHGPIGTDFLNAVEEAKLIAQKADVLVAPILMPGNSPYHMGFPGTITLSAETIQKVYFEAVQSLLKHGFRRFILLNGHGGNIATTRFIVDRINQETPGIAVELGEAIQPYLAAARKAEPVSAAPATAPVFDRHGGTPETSSSLYLTPTLVDMSKARTAPLKLPDHMAKMLPQVVAEDPTAKLLFLAEGLKAKETGKRTSTREMTETGVWGVADFKGATAARGKANVDRLVNASVRFIERWKTLRPMAAK
jgi:creatinine amidohydrolase